MNPKELNLIKTRTSEVDDVKKYVFEYGNSPVEVVYVDNHTGKDIVCVPSQTGCKLGCQFCHLTMNPRPQRMIEERFTFEAINHVLQDLSLPKENKTLLISFMGMGEPMLLPEYVLDVASLVETHHSDQYEKVRFALASIVPQPQKLHKLRNLVLENEIDLKIHWSLHHPDPERRKHYMPMSGDIMETADLLSAYREVTSNPIEVHYTLFDGNDSMETADYLAALMLMYDFPLKFLRFSQRPDKALNPSATEEKFIARVKELGVKMEFYTPPGHDILGACGEFES